MDDQPRSAVQEAERVQRGVQVIAGIGASTVDLALIIAFWGQWRVVLVIAGVGVVLALGNGVVLEWLVSKSGARC